MKCFYHSADLDGHCSGAIVKHAIPDCEMIGIDYGQPFPWDAIEKNEVVFMVDFSLQPFSDMIRLDKLASLVWIDHHKSAIWEYHNTPRDSDCPPLLGSVVLDTEYAACELCWKTFHGMKAMPNAVFFLGRYDIWKHEDNPPSLEFQYGMRLYQDTLPDNQAFWGDLFMNVGTTRILTQGETVLEYEKIQNAKFIKAYGFEMELDGLRCIACNRGMSNSQVFDSVYDPDKHDAMCLFAWKYGSWTVSLYSTNPKVDVSVICKARGGGGHKGAAGFQCDVLPFPPFSIPATGNEKPIFPE